MFSHSLLRVKKKSESDFMILKSLFSAWPVHYSSHAMWLGKLLWEWICFPSLEKGTCKRLHITRSEYLWVIQYECLPLIRRPNDHKILVSIQRKNKISQNSEEKPAHLFIFFFPSFPRQQLNKHISEVPSYLLHTYLCNPVWLSGHQFSSSYLPSINTVQ